MSGRLIPPLIAAAVGVVSGIYIWREPLEQYRAETGGVPPPAAAPETPRARKAEAGEKGVPAASTSVPAAEAKAPAEKAAQPAASASKES